MERYRCHKVVEAAKIARVFPAGIYGWLLVLEGAGPGAVETLEAKHSPCEGGYLVRYDDGYTSYSPAAAFEGGYHREVEGAGKTQAARSLERMARVCHEINRAYALATGEDPAVVFASWLEAPEEIRESARVGVRAALEGATPEQLHESWCMTKYADGWVYGSVKDLAVKTHPCLMPYADLPAAQQVKDALFQAVVKALR